MPYVSDLAYGTTGDGTVPLESATMLYRVLALDPSRWQLIRTNHIGTADSDEAVRSIRSVLDTGTLRESTGAAPGAYVVVKVTGPAAVTVTRGGETLSSELLDFGNTAAFGRMDIAGRDGEIKLFCLDPGDSAVTIRGTGSGTAQCEIRYYDAANTLTGVHSYSGIPLTKGAVLRTGTGAAQAASLEIDTDGDGTADRRVSG